MAKGLPLKNRLQEILNDNGTSQAEFARLCGVNTNTISQICSGKKTRISPAVLGRIKKTLEKLKEENPRLDITNAFTEII